MISTEEKKKISSDFLLSHADTFKSLNIKNPFFKCKVPYISSVTKEPVIGIFKNEFELGKDIYIQLVHTDYNIYSNKPELHVIKYNEDYNIEYISLGENNNLRYEVPIEELILANDIQEQPFLLELDEIVNDDIPLTDATLRDFASIMLKKPISNKKWLNDIINKK